MLRAVQATRPHRIPMEILGGHSPFEVVRPVFQARTLRRGVLDGLGEFTWWPRAQGGVYIPGPRGLHLGGVVTCPAGDMLCDATVPGGLGSGGGDQVFVLPSGVCLCGHHTEGPSCERCSPGFHGNPFAGQADDCQPCPCPGRSACTALPGSSEVVCTHCPPGQRGEWPVPWGPAAAWAPGVGSWLWSTADEGGPSLGVAGLT